MNDIDQILRENFPDVVRFRQTLTPESDRGCALIAASYLDAQLKALLTKCLVQDEGMIAEYFGPNGPMATFSSRIDTAYLLGKISPSVRRELHLIRKIRNDFGHNPEPISFEDSPISSRCSEFVYSIHESAIGARDHFTSAVCGILAAIHVSAGKTISPAPKEDCIPTEKSKTYLRGMVRDILTEVIAKPTDPRDEK